MVNRFDEKMFLDYVEGELDREQKDQFESHIAEDPQLRRLVTQVQEDRRQLRQAHQESPPTELMDLADRHLERNMLLDTPLPDFNPMAPRRRFRLSQYIAIGSLAAMVIVSSAVVIHTLIGRNHYDQFTPTAESDLQMAQKESDVEVLDHLAETEPPFPTSQKPAADERRFDWTSRNRRLKPLILSDDQDINAIEENRTNLAMSETELDGANQIDAKVASAKAQDIVAMDKSKADLKTFITERDLVGRIDTDLASAATKDIVAVEKVGADLKTVAAEGDMAGPIDVGLADAEAKNAVARVGGGSDLETARIEQEEAAHVDTDLAGAKLEEPVVTVFGKSKLAGIEQSKSVTVDPSELALSPPPSLEGLENLFARITPEKTDHPAPPARPLGPLARRVLVHVAKTLPAESKKNVAHSPAPEDVLLGPVSTDKTNDSFMDPSPTAVTVRLQTPDGATAQQALLAWVLAHDIQVLSLVHGGDRSGAAGFRHGGRITQSRKMTMTLTAIQLENLLAELNRTANQAAHVVPQMIHWHRRQALQPPAEGDFTGETRRFGNFDWAKTMQTQIPLRAVVPVFDPNTLLMLTLDIHETAKSNPKSQNVDP